MAFLRATARHLTNLLPQPPYAVWLVLLAGCWLAPPAAAQAPPSPEYKLKAVFLFNFAQFVEWPTNAFSDAKSPLIIGVLGDDPFGTYLDELVRGETVNNRPLKIERYRRVEDIQKCHILFISASENSRLDEVFKGLANRNILTVGDTDGFGRHAGMIRFTPEKTKLRLDINLDAAKAGGLTISSKLLRSAHVVTGAKD